MATHDYVIDNASGAAFRTDLNNALAAIVSNNSNSSSPATTYAYQWWADTTNGILKIRNSANNDWVELLQLDGTLTMEDGSVSTPGLAFRDDLNTGIFSSAADTFNVATGGVERMELGATTIFNEDGADVDFRIEGDNEANLFYVDASHDRIGIGTSSPASQYADHLVIDIGSEAQSGMTIKSTSSNSAMIAFSDATSGAARYSGYINYNHSEDSLSFGTGGGSERFRAKAAGLGIGDTSISFPSGSGLAIFDSSTPRIKLTNSTTGTGSSDGGFIYVSSSDLYIENKETAAIRFYTSATEKARLNSDGQLLINKTTDRDAYYGGTLTGNLQVEGTGNSTRLTQFIHNTNAASGHIVIIGKSRGTSAGSYTVVQDDDYLGTLSFQGADGDAMIEGARIDAIVDGTPGDQDMPTRLSFGTTADGGSSTSERFVIDSSGIVKIQRGSSADTALEINTTASSGATRFKFNQSGSNKGQIAYSHSNNQIEVIGNDGNGIAFLTNGVSNTAMTIDTSQRVGIGTTSMAERLLVVTTANTMVPLAINDSSSTATTTHRISVRTGGTEVGSIKSTNSATTFNTSSDYRLKENAVAISDGITRLKTLKPYRFNFKNNANKTLDGFFAHEVTAVPEAVDGVKDEVATQDHVDMGLAKEIGDPIYQSIDHSKLVPLLTASLQEAIAKIETLETKVAALEAA